MIKWVLIYLTITTIEKFNTENECVTAMNQASETFEKK